MRLNKLLQEDTSTNLTGIGLYPGRFQPFHKGHKSVYEYVKSNFKHAFIVTSDKTDNKKSPFNFQDKKRIITQLMNIPSSDLVQVRNPYQALEVVSKFDQDTHYAVFHVSQKDMDEDPRFQFPSDGLAMKKNGEPAYLQKWNGNPKPLSQHAYIGVAPTLDFKIAGKPVRSASEIRAMLSGENQDLARRAFVDLYGTFDQEIFDMMVSKIDTLQK
jgi:cytidyltransferase-like protein